MCCAMLRPGAGDDDGAVLVGGTALAQWQRKTPPGEPGGACKGRTLQLPLRLPRLRDQIAL
jgi:hypothetical protein